MQINGTIEPRFRAVGDAFMDNFTRRGEVGAALCVYHRGRPVVDLYAGMADAAEARPWRADTLTVVDSVTKALTQVCALMLVQCGALELDAPVARYWPEFAAAGKSEITIRQVLAHQAGVPAVSRWISEQDLDEWTPFVHALEAQRPYWRPGSAHGYHGVTIGWLLGEPIRRVTGMTPGRFLRTEIASRLDLDMWIGLPAEEEPRVAPTARANVTGTDGYASTSGDPDFDEMNRQMTELYSDPEFFDQLMNPTKRSPRFFDRSLTLAQLAFCTTEVGHDTNSRAYHAMEAPSMNGICTAHALARFGSALVGEVGGVRLIEPSLMAEAVTPMSTGRDEVVLSETSWGLGFELPGGRMFPSQGPGREFGQGGANGSLLYANLDQQLSIGYVRNQMLPDQPDPRAFPLVAAVYDCLGLRRQ